jgi:putative nucleotidyltransferase with HDIG domain
MTPRPRFTSRLTRVRNAVLGVVLRPLRWFSPATQLVFGFTFMVVVTTLLLSKWPLTLNSLGLLVLVLASYFVVWRFVESREAAVDLSISKRRAFALIGSAIVVETVVMRLGFMVATGLAGQSTQAPLNDPSVWTFTIPFAAASLLVTMLLDRQLGLIAGVIACVFAGLLAPNGAQATLYAFISCSAAVYGIKRYRERQSVTLAGLVVAGVNCVTALALIAFAQHPVTLTGALVAAGCAIGGGLLTIIFAAGGVPINESLFGILTDIRLLELSNADLPVLSQLALRAPGTNQHSHAVGQLAEEACRAIGANALLARIGSLYHDIGKVAAPDHFVENQIGGNPHDRLRPVQSAKIITSHVTYGLKLAKEIGLPKRVADFIPQHHGTRTLHFFLQKAEDQLGNGEKVNEAEFRYPGPKPQFKEAAILMLADSAEAAARSLAHPDPESIRAIVVRVFDAIVSDRQLDECNLTLRELTQIRETLIASLNALYHARVDYPGFNVTQLPPTTEVQANHEERGVVYENASDVPINPSGEVEDEALSRKAGETPHSN